MKWEQGNVLESPYKDFEAVFKDVWGNNADAISTYYSGTGALKVRGVEKEGETCIFVYLYIYVCMFTSVYIWDIHRRTDLTHMPDLIGLCCVCLLNVVRD